MSLIFMGALICSFGILIIIKKYSLIHFVHDNSVIYEQEDISDIKAAIKHFGEESADPRQGFSPTFNR